MKHVYLVTTGDGWDGYEWNIISIHKTHEGAEEGLKYYTRDRFRKDGSIYNYKAQIEDWELKD